MKCKCRIVTVPFQRPHFEKCPLCASAPELYRLLDLIVMEFNTDPTSVACFDLDAIVEPAKRIVAKVAESRS